ncbi:hypothetical protein DSM3645_24440 [Blastopirellula marina DSM 3645]|uniref:Uncharacterized protein n=1 Tax=Blastopirellula marina DSM 3645 TaxID=314230 RepID=A3ZUX9_9BACT|nr:hypothetical protein DSM3645_24440 [Blastopirellula marina DSM 3645]
MDDLEDWINRVTAAVNHWWSSNPDVDELEVSRDQEKHGVSVSVKLSIDGQMKTARFESWNIGNLKENSPDFLVDVRLSRCKNLILQRDGESTP